MKWHRIKPQRFTHHGRLKHRNLVQWIKHWKTRIGSCPRRVTALVRFASRNPNCLGYWDERPPFANSPFLQIDLNSALIAIESIHHEIRNGMG